MITINSFIVCDIPGRFRHEHFHFVPAPDGTFTCADVIWAEGRITVFNWYDGRGRTGGLDEQR